MFSQNNQKTNCFSKEYLLYSNFLNTLDISNETKDWRLKHIKGFDYFIHNKKLTYSNFNINDVYEYMDSISNLASRTKENRAVCIRLFLNYLYSKHKIKFSGNNVFPEIASTKYSTIPSHYSDNEVKSLLKNMDKTSETYKRDLAILLIFINYGLRLKDVQKLSLKNINWIDNKIQIVQSKDNEINTFTMSEEIRYALLDYLKNERALSDTDIIFLTFKGTPISSSGFYYIVSKSFKRANIETSWKHHGPHSLRHSLAVSLLNQKISIKEIAYILSHDNIESTKEYARVDSKQLKKFSLEVPLWKN